MGSTGSVLRPDPVFSARPARAVDSGRHWLPSCAYCSDHGTSCRKRPASDFQLEQLCMCSQGPHVASPVRSASWPGRLDPVTHLPGSRLPLWPGFFKKGAEGFKSFPAWRRNEHRWGHISRPAQTEARCHLGRPGKISLARAPAPSAPVPTVTQLRVGGVRVCGLLPPAGELERREGVPQRCGSVGFVASITSSHSFIHQTFVIEPLLARCLDKQTKGRQAGSPDPQIHPRHLRGRAAEGVCAGLWGTGEGSTDPRG